nr:uncharacterized protein LOC131742623 [Kogia breviceps]
MRKSKLKVTTNTGPILGAVPTETTLPPQAGSSSSQGGRAGREPRLLAVQTVPSATTGAPAASLTGGGAGLRGPAPARSSFWSLFVPLQGPSSRGPSVLREDLAKLQVKTQVLDPGFVQTTGDSQERRRKHLGAGSGERRPGLGSGARAGAPAGDTPESLGACCGLETEASGCGHRQRSRATKLGHSGQQLHTASPPLPHRLWGSTPGKGAPGRATGRGQAPRMELERERLMRPQAGACQHWQHHSRNPQPPAGAQNQVTAEAAALDRSL